MRMLFRRLILLGLALCLPASLRAEVPALTWDDCVKEATANNPDLQKAAANLRSARFDKKGAAGAFLPTLSAGASANRSGDEGSIAGILKDDDPHKSYSMSLNAQVNLFNGFKDKASFDQASLSQRMAEVQYRQARAQLSSDLKGAFYNLLYAQQLLQLSRDIAARQKENVRMVGLRYDSGHENKGSLLNSQATSAQSDLDVTQAERSLRLAQRRLDLVLGRDETDQPVVQGAFDVAPPETAPVFEALAQTLPTVLLAQLQEKASESRVTSARGDFLPSLNASASMSRSGNDWVPHQAGWGAGLSLSFPLFEGGRRVFTLQSAKADRDASRAALLSTTRSAALSLETAYWNLRNAMDTSVVQKQYLAAARTQEEVATAQYANGLLTYQNWDLVESSLISREKSELQSRRSAKDAETAWQLSLGKDELP